MILNNRITSIFLRYWYVSLAGVSLLLFYISPSQSVKIERIYANGVYPIFRMFWDFLFGWIPIPLIYLLLIIVLVSLFFQLRKIINNQAHWASVAKWGIKVISLSLVAFYWCWGFHYKRVKAWDGLQIPRVEIDSMMIRDEYLRVSDSLISLRNLLTEDDVSRYPDRKLLANLSAELKGDFEAMGIRVYGRPNVRMIYPRGVLLHISTAGVYLPWVSEGHVDAGLHPIVVPFTAIHELAHAYGQTDEDMCNFWALISGLNHADPFVRYSSYFSYWRYIRAALFQHRTLFDQTARNVPDSIAKDYKAIIAYAERYPDILPKLRDLFYDTYLKSHGVQDGLASYNKMVQRALEWKHHFGDFTL